jgi:hypothetical protein
MPLSIWTRPNNYTGPEWSDYYVFLSQTRDSDTLTRSNFICALEQVGGESETVIVVNESHWAVGWIEWIAIHKDDAKSLAIAEDIAEALESYPVVNEDHWSELEWNEACDFWESLSISERIAYCKDVGLSIFAARSSTIPPDDNGALYDLLTRH